MFSFWFQKSSNMRRQGRGRRSDLQAERDQFMLSYHSLQRAFCLCDGLDIIAANAAFLKLFKMSGKQVETTLLDRLFDNQRITELLFSYPGKTIDFSINAKDDRTALDLAATLHKLTPHASSVILEIENRTDEGSLRNQLRDARERDPQSGALRGAAFAHTLQQIIATEPHIDNKYLLIGVHIRSGDCAGFGLNFEQRGEFLATLTQKLIEELGDDVVVGRTDALALSIFAPISHDEDETLHIIAQTRRITQACIHPFNDKLDIAIGAAVYPDHATTLSALQSNTNLALEDEKNTLFSDKMRENADRRAALLKDLPDALARGDIAPHFQPVISASENVLISFEALIRWHHPTLGRVIPPHIVEMATEIDLLHELTAKTLTHAITQASLWPANIKFAINVTPSQLNSALVDLVRSAIRASTIGPDRVEIEVTEEALIENFEASADIIARLRAIGVSVAMDDFGAGYTSIGNLRRLAFSKIKIDKSISDGLPDDAKTIAIVRSLMIMARELEVEVTVEGIETQEQLEFLRAFHCGIQGYVFSPPLPPENLTELRHFLKMDDRKQANRNVLAIGPKKSQSTSH